MTLSFFFKRSSKNVRLEKAREIVQNLRRGEASYSDIFQLFHLVRGESKEPLEQFIARHSFSEQAQNYLLDLVKAAEKCSYLEGEGAFQFRYDKKSFQELLNYMSKRSTS